MQYLMAALVAAEAVRLGEERLARAVAVEAVKKHLSLFVPNRLRQNASFVL